MKNTTHYTLFRGREIRYKSEGSGKAVVLLHGFLESLDIWKEFSTKLSRQFRVISIDLPGHGGSDIIDSIHPMDLMAEVVKGVLDHCGIKSCVMAGHSMGGYVMLSFAKHYGEYLRGICLFNSHAMADTPDAKVNRSRAIGIIRQNRQGFISQFIPDLFAPDNIKRFKQEILLLQEQAMAMSSEAIIASIEGMKARQSQIDLLEKTNLPVLFIIGRKDKRADFSSMLEHISLPAHSESLILNECGHMGWLEAREVTLPALQSFAFRFLH